MKLNCLLLFCFLPLIFNLSIYSLSKYGSYTSTSSSPDSIYYLNLKNSFDSDETIYFEMVVYYGKFSSYSMYYRFDNSYHDYLNLNDLLRKSYSMESTTSSYYSYYNEHTLYFKLDNNNYNYLYFAYPSFYKDTSRYSYIKVYNTTSFGLAVGIIVAIVIVVIIIIAASIIVTVICRRRRRMLTGYVNPPVPVYAPPVAPAYPPPTYY